MTLSSTQKHNSWVCRLVHTILVCNNLKFMRIYFCIFYGWYILKWRGPLPYKTFSKKPLAKNYCQKLICQLYFIHILFRLFSQIMLEFDTTMLVLFRILRLVWCFGVLVFCYISGKTHQIEHKSSTYFESSTIILFIFRLNLKEQFLSFAYYCFQFMSPSYLGLIAFSFIYSCLQFFNLYCIHLFRSTLV